jgi:glycosyltransferase involved in cell wall biosynthesis
MNEPLVSICIPTYNGKDYLRECLDSAIAQTYRNIEIIIVDDKSNDETFSIVSEYKKADNRIKLSVNEENLGLVGNWNRCVALSSGKWIKFLFQDDRLHPKCIERMVECITDNCRMISCDREFVFEEDTSKEIRDQYENKLISLKGILNMKRPAYINSGEIIHVVSHLINANFIGEPTVVMFEKSLVNEVGEFDPLLVQICDLEYWLRITTRFGLFYIPETLAYFRVHNQSMTASNRNARMDLVDKVVLCFKLLESEYYHNFRKHLSMFMMTKITMMFKFRIYELELFLRNNPNMELSGQFKKIKDSIPSITKFETPSLGSKLIFALVMLKRKIRY